MSMKIKDYEDYAGCAPQGDLLIYRLPDDIKVGRKNSIEPKNGKFVLLEGEMTGHHHSVDVMDRPMASLNSLAEAVEQTKGRPKKTSKTVEDMFAAAADVQAPVVGFYKDDGVVQELVKRKILTNPELYIGTLTVEGGGDVGVVARHQEHDGIRLKQGNYYVGRQVESVGTELRKVQD